MESKELESRTHHSIGKILDSSTEVICENYMAYFTN